MKQFKFSALWLIVALLADLQSGFGQAVNANVQNVPSRAAPGRAAPAVRPIVNAGSVPRIAPRPPGVVPRAVGSYAPPSAQSAPNVLPNYSVVGQPLNRTVAAINAQSMPRNSVQETITLDPVTRQNELRTLAAMRERRGTRTHNRMLATMDPQRRVMTHDRATRPAFEMRESPGELPRTKWHNRNDQPSYSDAARRHWHEWHDRNWWHHHCDTIVFVIGGYYFLDGNYWYPAWGYDPLQSYYDYDGPIYTYGNLLPDEVIANVQTALQDAGYYLGAITGSLNVETRAALANFQRDYGLAITGAIDEATIETLGLT